MDQPFELIAFMARHLEPGNLTAAVKCVLIQLYIPTDSKGYRCLIVAIPLYNEDPEQSLTKEIYPAVAKLLGCFDWKKVEKNIRDAIGRAWSKRDPEIWKQYFQKNRKPGNWEFVSRISEILDIWAVCVKAKEEYT